MTLVNVFAGGLSPLVIALIVLGVVILLLAVLLLLVCVFIMCRPHQFRRPLFLDHQNYEYDGYKAASLGNTLDNRIDRLARAVALSPYTQEVGHSEV